MVVFLFQMVFMDTALTIVTGAAAERWKYVAFGHLIRFFGCDHVSLFANWAWGGGWLSQLGANFGLATGMRTSPVLVWSILWAVSPRWRWQ